MRQPHAVPILDRRAHVLPVDIAMFLSETGIPQSGMCSVLAREVRCLLDRMTKASWAHHRAIGAGKASPCHLVPSRMFVSIIESLRQAGVIQPSDLTLGAGVDTRRCLCTQLF